MLDDPKDGDRRIPGAVIEDQTEVVAFLSDPATHGGCAVRVIETHGAMVFLAGDRALKKRRITQCLIHSGVSLRSTIFFTTRIITVMLCKTQDNPVFLLPRKNRKKENLPTDEKQTLIVKASFFNP